MKLKAGQFYGATSRNLATNNFHLSEQTYPGQSLFPPHSHELSHFCFVLSGTYREEISATGFDRDSNALIFYPPDTSHSERHFTSGRHLLVEIEVSELERVREYGVALDQPITLNSQSALALALKIYREFFERDEYSALVLDSIIPELMVSVSRQDIKRGEKNPPIWLKTIKEYLLEHYIARPGLGKLAMLIGVHPTHLVRVFRQFEHMTIGDFIRRLRIQKARQKLIDTDIPIAEIALQFGYTDQPHFTRAFKKETGMSPGKFRNLLKPAKFVQK